MTVPAGALRSSTAQSCGDEPVRPLPRLDESATEREGQPIVGAWPRKTRESAEDRKQRSRIAARKRGSERSGDGRISERLGAQGARSSTIRSFLGVGSRPRPLCFRGLGLRTEQVRKGPHPRRASGPGRIP